MFESKNMFGTRDVNQTEKYKVTGIDFNKLFSSDTTIHRIQLFGSRFVGCATADSDYDYLVLVDHKPGTDSIFSALGFEPDTLDPAYGVDFSSWRKGNVNFVFTTDRGYFDATMEAAEFCRKYAICDKGDRIRVHESFRDKYKFDTEQYPSSFKF